jgi:hypothetical protein
MRFDFLTVCTPTLNDKEAFLLRLVESLQATWDDNVEEYSLDILTSDEAKRMLNVVLQRAITSSRESEVIEQVVYGFEINFDVNKEEFLETNRVESNYIRNIINQFAEALNDDEDIKHVSKFYDELLLEHNLRLMGQIFEIEMNLRKALALIYFSAYKDEYYNVLRNDLVTLRKEDRNADRMKTFIENEFFFIDFSQYAALNQFPKPKTVDDILDILQESENFDVFREKLNLPIKDEKDSDLLLSIKSQLDSHQKLRNCLAHNRTSSSTIRKDYEIAKITLDRVFEEYFKQFSAE